MRRRGRIIALVAFVLLGAAAPARAQSGGPLSSLVLNLFDIRLDPTPIFVPETGSSIVHAPHFTLREPGLGSPSLEPLLFIQSITAQLSTFPLGSSSGGFTYSFDPGLGTLTRSSQTFGPLFGERAVTLGRRKVNVGASFQHIRFDRFEGQKLEGDDLVFFIEHQRVGSFVEGDLIRTELNLGITQDTLSIFANYGMTDRFDVGLVVPIVRVGVEARREAQILRLATGTADTHRFPEGGGSAVRTESASASGIGDVLLRAKYAFLRQGRAGLAGGVDVRLPTGDQADLLGTGETQIKLLLIGSTVAGRWSPHFNIGYTVSGGADAGSSLGLEMPDELNYVAGVEAAVGPRVTVGADLAGRSLRGFGRMRLLARDHQFRTSNAPGAPVQTISITQLRLRKGESVDLLLGVGGVKVNIAGNMLVSASVLFPLTEAGLRARTSVTFGFDYTF